jgi:hypothetical protein
MGTWWYPIGYCENSGHSFLEKPARLHFRRWDYHGEITSLVEVLVHSGPFILTCFGKNLKVHILLLTWYIKIHISAQHWKKLVDYK